MILDFKAYQEVLLALLIWREARGEDEMAQTAVACCVRERVRHPGWWGDDWVSVCSLKYQFSSLGAPNDPQLIVWPQQFNKEFAVCLEIASGVIAGHIQHPAPGANSYFDDSIKNHPPDWAKVENFCGKIGRLSFYRVP